MTPSSILDLTYQSLILVLLLSMPAVLTSAVVGLVIAILQAVTQIQDQSISQAVKLVAVTAVLILTASWAGGELYNFAKRILNNLSVG